MGNITHFDCGISLQKKIEDPVDKTLTRPSPLMSRLHRDRSWLFSILCDGAGKP